MAKTLQYQARSQRLINNYDVLYYATAAANPGTSASVTIVNPVIDYPRTIGWTLLVGIAGQSGVTYSVSTPQPQVGGGTIISRDGVGTHAEIQWLPPTPANAGATVTVTVTASSSVKFGFIVICYNGSMLPCNPYKDQWDSNVDAPGTSHVCGATGFTTSNTGSFTLGIGCPSSDPGFITYDPNFIGIPAPNGLVVFQCASRDAPNSITTQGSFTTSNSVGESTNVLATFTLRTGSTPSSFTQPIQSTPQILWQPPPRPDPGWWAMPVKPIPNVAVPTWGYVPQAIDLTFPAKPAYSGLSEQVDPTSFVKQKLDWYVEQPVAPPLTREAQPGHFVHPVIWPVPANVVLPISWYVQQPGPVYYTPQAQPGCFVFYPEPYPNFAFGHGVFQGVFAGVPSGANPFAGVPSGANTAAQ